MQVAGLSPRIALKVFEEKDAPVWDSFIDGSINGTIFHKRLFLNYHPSSRFADSSLLFTIKNRLAAVFPAAAVLDDGKKVLKSHPGSSFGGLVVDAPPGIHDANLLVQELERFAAVLGFDRIEFRSAPRIYSTYPADELDFALRLNGFQVRDIELSTCYPVSRIQGPPTDENIIATFDDTCRRAVKKALREGIDARVAEKKDFGQFWDILAENLKKHRTKPTHSKAELLDLKDRFPDDIQLIASYEKGKMTAGVVAFVVNANAAHVFYFGSLYEHQGKRGLNLAVLRLIQYAASRGLKFVNFGISTENRGERVNWGLFRFKESFGGHGVTRSYWVKDLSWPRPVKSSNTAAEGPLPSL